MTVSKTLPRVLVFSKATNLSSSFVRRLIDSGCRVVVVSSEYATWRDKLEGVIHDRLSIVDKRHLLTDSEFNYVVYFSSSSDLQSVSTDIEILLKIAKDNDAKVLLSFPYYCSSSFVDSLQSKVDTAVKGKSRVAVVFVGDDISTNVSLINGKQSFIGDSEEYFFLDNSIGAGELVKSLFSFGSVGKSSAYISEPINKNEIRGLGIDYVNQESEPKKTFSVDEEYQIDFNLSYELKNIFGTKEASKYESDGSLRRLVVVEEDESFVSNEDKELESVEIIKTKKYKSNTKPKTRKKRLGRKISLSKRKKRMIVSVGVSIILIFVIIPFLLLLTNVTLLSMGVKYIKADRTDRASIIIAFGEPLSGFGSLYFKSISRFPLVGPIYSDLYDTISLSNQVFEVGTLYIQSRDLAEGIYKSSVNEEIYNLPEISSDLSLSLAKLHREVSLIEAEVVQSNSIVSNIIKNNFNLKDIRNVIFYSSIVSTNTEELLGDEETKYYAIVLLNNLDLRPSGGVVESVGILTVNDGRISDTTVYSVDELDKRLLGFIDPPDDLVEFYLEDQSWVLKDASWSTDFESASKSMIWFLEKELDLVVSGIVTVDLNAIEVVLAESGEMPFGGYESSKTSEYVKNGDRVFTNYLDAYMASILSIGRNYQMIGEIKETFDKKMSLLYFINPEIEDLAVTLGYSGEVKSQECGSNCFNDRFGIYESNMDRNNSNYFIDRELNVDVSLEDGLVVRKADLKISNNSKNEYSTYVRIVVPQASGFRSVKVEGGDFKSTEHSLEPAVSQVGQEIVAGVEVEVLPESSLEIGFIWESPNLLNFEYGGEYILSLIKQPGVNSYPVSFKYELPDDAEIVLPEGYSLTDGSLLRYNTDVEGDIVTSVAWE